MELHEYKYFSFDGSTELGAPIILRDGALSVVVNQRAKPTIEANRAGAPQFVFAGAKTVLRERHETVGSAQIQPRNSLKLLNAILTGL
jgi:hypothetical protein